MGLPGLGLAGFLLGLVLLVELGDAAGDLGVEFGALDLAQDGRVVVFVDRERLLAMGTDKFVHIHAKIGIFNGKSFPPGSARTGRICRISQGPTC